MKTPVLPLLLGLSLCGIGGAMLYVYFKNKDDEADRNQPDEINDNIGDVVNSPKRIASKSALNGKPKVPQKEITREIVIENEVAPIVIGRNLSNLKMIEDSSGASVWFKDKNDGKSQICFVKGPLDAVANAEDLIKESIKRANRVTEEILVPQSACGKIMGRCGDSLQEISRKSKAKVSIESGDRGDGKIRRVLVTGNQSQVNIAKLLIEEKVKEDAEARRVIEDAEAKREPRGGIRTPTGMTPASSRESLPSKFEKLSSTSSDGQLEVYVSAIASPAKFWLQIVGPQTSELDLLCDRLTDYYNQPTNQIQHKIREPYLGQIVAAMFKHDGKWYRAEIISIQPNEYSPNEVVLDLYFVDYGDSQYVGPHEIFELRTDFLMLRFQAIECFLAHVQPAVGDDPELWDVQAISRFEELTHVGQWKKMLSRTVTYKERTKGDTRIRREGSPVPGVELYDSSEGEFFFLLIFGSQNDFRKFQLNSIMDDVIFVNLLNILLLILFYERRLIMFLMTIIMTHERIDKIKYAFNPSWPLG